MERYSYTDMLLKCYVAPSKIIRNPKVLSPIWVDPWSKKIRSPNSSALNPLTRDLSGPGFVELQNGQGFHHMLVKIMNLPRKIQMSCPLFEMRSGHMVMLQVKVPQVSFIQ